MESSGGNASGSIQASLSGRYATALFDLAQEGGTIAAVEQSLRDLRQAIDASDELRALVDSPLIARELAVKAIDAVAAELATDPLTRRFLGVLAQNRRLSQLPHVIRDFRSLSARHRGEVTAEVASAHPLTDDQLDQLKQQLRTRVGRDVSVDTRVDPSLLGGLVVKIGSQMIDSSIKTRLNTLAHAMKG